MASNECVEWALRKGIAQNYIAPGEINQNAYIERFNRTLQTEVLCGCTTEELLAVSHPSAWPCLRVQSEWRFP